MKKILLSILIILTIAGCKDASKENAAQFVREALGNIDVESIEVIDTDSALCYIPLSYEMNSLIKNEVEFYENKISADSLQKRIERITQIHQDITYSWMYGILVNDSLKKVPYYNDAWRKVHTVQVTYPSTVKQQTRVIMDRDGITPNCLEKDFIDAMNKYSDDIVGISLRTKDR